MRQGTYSVYSSKTCSPWRNFRYHQVPISFSHPPIQWLRINIIYTQQQKSSTNQFPHLFCFFWAFFPKQLRYFFRVSTKSFLPPLKRRSFDVGLQDYLSRYAVDDMGCDALRRCHSRSARSSNLVGPRRPETRFGQVVVGLLVGVEGLELLRAGMDNIYTYIYRYEWYDDIWNLFVYLYTVYSPYVYVYIMYPVSNCWYPKEEILWSQSGMALKPWPIVG